MLESGAITEETLVWTEGMEEWCAWGEVKEWFGFNDDAGFDAAGVEEWLGSLSEEELQEQCQASEIELEDWSEDNMKAALRAIYIPADEDDEDEGPIESVIYQTAGGEYSDETSLADAWELWKIRKVITVRAPVHMNVYCSFLPAHGLRFLTPALRFSPGRAADCTRTKRFAGLKALTTGNRGARRSTCSSRRSS